MGGHRAEANGRRRIGAPPWSGQGPFGFESGADRRHFQAHSYLAAAGGARNGPRSGNLRRNTSGNYDRRRILLLLWAVRLPRGRTALHNDRNGILTRTKKVPIERGKDEEGKSGGRDGNVDRRWQWTRRSHPKQSAANQSEPLQRKAPCRTIFASSLETRPDASWDSQRLLFSSQ